MALSDRLAFHRRLVADSEAQLAERRQTVERLELIERLQSAMSHMTARARIVWILSQAPDVAFSAGELIDGVGHPPMTTRRLLQDLVNDGDIENVWHGYYRLAH